MRAMGAKGSREAADARVVLTTAPDRETALELARGLVERRLAACVNVVDGVTSVYRWRAAIEEQREVLLVIKTVRGRLEALERDLADRHPYDVPECIALDPRRVEERYLAWLFESCETPPGDGP